MSTVETVNLRRSLRITVHELHASLRSLKNWAKPNKTQWMVYPFARDQRCEVVADRRQSGPFSVSLEPHLTAEGVSRSGYRDREPRVAVQTELCPPAYHVHMYRSEYYTVCTVQNRAVQPSQGHRAAVCPVMDTINIKLQGFHEATGNQVEVRPYSVVESPDSWQIVRTERPLGLVVLHPDIRSNGFPGLKTKAGKLPFAD